MNLNDRLIASPLPGRPFLAATAVLTAAALVMTQLPLVGDLGFEFAVLTAFIAAFATGFTTIHLVAAWRRSHGKETTLSTLLAPLFGFSLATLFLPLDVMFIKSWISGFCNVSEGLAFYLLLPGITVLWSTSVATLCALATERKLRATLLFIAVMFASIGISVYRLATQPPVFAYNPIIGYFPGPIYDEVVVISSTLLAARGIVLVSVLAMVAGLYVCFDPVARKIRPSLFLELRGWKSDKGRIATRVLFLAAVAVLAAAYVYRAPLGIVIDREHIQQTLGGHERTAHFDIYYDLNADTAQNIELIAGEHEYQLSAIAAYLEVPPPSTRIASYIYANADQKKRLMGARHTSMERPGSDEMHLNDARFPHPVLKHELVHVPVRLLWKLPVRRQLLDGFPRRPGRGCRLAGLAHESTRMEPRHAGTRSRAVPGEPARHGGILVGRVLAQLHTLRFLRPFPDRTIRPARLQAGFSERQRRWKPTGWERVN